MPTGTRRPQFMAPQFDGRPPRIIPEAGGATPGIGLAAPPPAPQVHTGSKIPFGRISPQQAIRGIGQPLGKPLTNVSRGDFGLSRPVPGPSSGVSPFSVPAPAPGIPPLVRPNGPGGPPDSLLRGMDAYRADPRNRGATPADLSQFEPMAGMGSPGLAASGMPNVGGRAITQDMLDRAGTYTPQYKPPVPGENPLSDQLRVGGNPITRPTGGIMAQDAMSTSPGGLMDNSTAADVYRNSPRDSKYAARTTAGGAYGLPSPAEIANRAFGQPNGGYGGPEGTGVLTGEQVLNNSGRMAQYRSMNSTPLGLGYANSQADYDARMAQDNPGGRSFGGALPTKINGRVQFVDGPMKDFGEQRKLPIGDSPGSPTKYYKNDNGQIVRGNLFTKEDAAKADAAKKMFDDRRGGLAARQAAYEERTKARGGRGAMISEARQEQAKARMERLRMGSRLSIDEANRLYRPEIGAQKEIAKSQLGLADAQRQSTDEFRKAQLAQQAQNIKDTNASRERIAQTNAGARQDRPDQVKPYTFKDFRNISKEEARAQAERQGMGPAEFNDMMNSIHGTQNHNYWENPGGPGFFTGTTPAVTQPRVPEPGAPNRARMGGGMQLPPSVLGFGSNPLVTLPAPRGSQGSLGDDRNRSLRGQRPRKFD